MILTRGGLLTLLATGLTGCVTPIPVSEQTISPSYVGERPVLISVVDDRLEIREGKPANFIGRMHLAFGIPADMTVYPVISEDKKYKDQSLAAALEERIVEGFNRRGWKATTAGLVSHMARDNVANVVSSHNADRLLILTLDKWFVSINTSWVSAFNFDWAVRVEIFDKSGAYLANYQDSGRDVVDEEYNQSPGNHIRLVYKERLTKILEDSRVREALATATTDTPTPR